jgi:hypothetical protein
MRDVEDLAEKLFDASEREKSIRGDFGAANLPHGVGPGMRRWTGIDERERDLWRAAARVAWKQVGLARLGESTAKTELGVVKGKLRDAVDCALNIKGPSAHDRDEYRGYMNELRTFGEDET